MRKHNTYIFILRQCGCGVHEENIVAFSGRSGSSRYPGVHAVEIERQWDGFGEMERSESPAQAMSTVVVVRLHDFL